MSYIIEHATLYQGGKWMDTALSVKNNKIFTIHTSVERMSGIRMDFSRFIMTPPYTFLEFQPQNLTDKEYVKERLILRGAACVMAVPRIQYACELAKALHGVQNMLEHFPLDIVKGIRLPCSAFTPDFILKCKKNRIAVIFIEISKNDQLETVPWEWIRQNAFPYNPVLVPVMDSEHFLNEWDSRLSRLGIKHLTHCPAGDRPLSEAVLKTFGIYPFKGFLHSGGEISYNLFEKLDGEELLPGIFSGGYDRLVVTVLDGKLIRAGQRVDTEGLRGRELVIRVPGFFTAS
ncbi:hypothetical protein V1498_08010 [Peribacillus sp. SCS-26]|uniref:hypothetical protein n=1 Tax=Paraperibacillus marinus TaxID=3115295 RepID=UPI003906AEC6